MFMCPSINGRGCPLFNKPVSHSQFGETAQNYTVPI